LGGETHPTMKGKAMRKLRVRVETPGKLVSFKNRQIRSPFTLDIYDSELKLLKTALASSDIGKYIIEEIDQSETVWEKVIVSNEETVVEELFEESEEEPKTFLEKLLKDSRMENKQ
jgi:hypothetical protein